MATKHAKLKCDQCPFTSASQFSHTLHKEQNHPQPEAQILHPCHLCGMTFAIVSDLESHIQRRHTETVLPAKSSDHSFSILLEEQIDMALTLKEFKESVSAKLSVIQNEQEALKVNIKQLLDDNAVFRSSSITLFESLQSNLHDQISKMSSTFAAKTSPPQHSSEVPPQNSPSTSPASPPPSSSSGPAASFPSFSKTSPSTRSSLEDPRTDTNMNNNNNFTTPAPPPNCTPPPQTSTPPRTSAPPHTSASPRNPDQHQQSKSVRLLTSKRPKVLYIADSIGSIADIRHLEEATNTLIYSKKAFGASYKADAYKPNENFVYVAKNAAPKRNYSFAVLQGSSTDITNLQTSSPNHNLEFLKKEVIIALYFRQPRDNTWSQGKA